MTISLGRALPSASMLCSSFGRAVPRIERSCFGWGLPECASPRDSVSSYLTISPLRELQRSPRGMFLWHFPSSRPDRTLSCTLPYEARTFLTPDSTLVDGGAVIQRTPRRQYTTPQ